MFWNLRDSGRIFEGFFLPDSFEMWEFWQRKGHLSIKGSNLLLLLKIIGYIIVILLYYCYIIVILIIIIVILLLLKIVAD